MDPSIIYIGETRRNAEVHNNSHGLHWDDSLSNVAIGTYSASIELPRCHICYRPNNVALRTRNVVKIVLRVILAIVPVVVEVCQARQSLLVRSALIAIEMGD